MTQIMQLLDSWNNGVTSRQLWASESKEGARNLTQSQARRMSNPKYEQAFLRFEEAYLESEAGNRKAHKFVKATLEGDFDALVVLHEAIEPSDFPLILGDTLDRLLLVPMRFENLASHVVFYAH